MSKKEQLDSLIDYIKDVKPYHTKFREIISRLNFADDLNVNLTEDLKHSVHFQNVWSRDDISGYTMTSMSQGIAADKFFLLPPAVYPRFTVTDSIQYNQTPMGDDPPVLDTNDADQNNIPDTNDPWIGVDPWVGARTASHQREADQAPVTATILSFTQTITSQGMVGGFWRVIYDLKILVDVTEELLYDFDSSALHLVINGDPYLGAYTKNGNEITVLGYSQNFVSAASYQLFAKRLQRLQNDSGIEGVIAKNLDGSSIFIQVLYLRTGRYAVPYHQGSRVRVNNTVKTLGEDYTIDKSRSFIQFLPGRWPETYAYVDINLYRSDRLFISYLYPFAWANNGYSGDGVLYEYKKYDNLINDVFTITVNADRVCEVEFFNSEPTKAKATLQGARALSQANAGDVFKVIAIAPWKFSVQRVLPLPASTVIQNAYFKEPYDDGTLSFIIDSVWNSFYAIEGDLIPGSPGWDNTHFTDAPYDDGINPVNRFYSFFIEQDANSYWSYSAAVRKQADPAEFFSDVGIRTEHGVITDPIPNLHHPVHYIPFGHVKKRAVTTVLTGIQEEYIFEFEVIPPRGTYIEFRLEQEGQFNQWTNVNFTETVNFYDLFHFNDGVCYNSQSVYGQYARTVGEPMPAHWVGPNSFYPPQRNIQFSPFVETYDTTPYDETDDSYLPANLANLGYDVIPQPYDDSSLPTLVDIRLFTPTCLLDDHTYDMKRYEEIGYDRVTFYPHIREEMFLTIEYQDTMVDWIIHDVELHSAANFYQEFGYYHDQRYDGSITHNGENLYSLDSGVNELRIRRPFIPTGSPLGDPISGPITGVIIFDSSQLVLTPNFDYTVTINNTYSVVGPSYDNTDPDGFINGSLVIIKFINPINTPRVFAVKIIDLVTDSLIHHDGIILYNGDFYHGA